ncbi:MAG: transglutaminase-like domain-containing protein [Bifidobacteriaceae bacterium]|jgi:transglutaminase-like putative cysteine protease|nr:transglutaminase-like domain-containing protein [Bifidobacteriaceae bacterium]
MAAKTAPRPAALVGDLAAIGLLIALATTPLVPVFGLAVLLRAVVGGIVGALVVTLAISWLRWRLPAGLAAIACGYVLAGTPAAVPAAAAWQVLPTWTSLRLLVRGLASSWKDILTVPVPIGAGGGFAVAPFALSYLAVAAAWLMLTRFSQARRPLAGLVPVVVAAICLVLRAQPSFQAVAAGLAATIGALVWVAHRRGSFQRRRVVAGLVMVAVIAAAGVGADRWRARSAPERLVVREHVVPPFDPSALASPLAAYRHYVRDLDQAELATAQGLPADQPLRLATMDAFDGIVWNVAGPESSGSGEFVRPAAADVPEPGGDRVDVTITAAGLGGVWLPTVGRPSRIELIDQDPALTDSVRVNSQTNAAALPGGLPDQLSYRQSGWAPPPDASQVMLAGPGRALVPQAESIPDPVLAAASTYTADTATAGEAALALAEGLRRDGYFADGSATAGPAVSMAGHGSARIDTLFLQEPMVGNSEQYASAMALMARSLGLGSRVVLGFPPAELGDDAAQSAPRPGAAEGSVVFTGADLTAWVEIDLAGLGWVSFYPTPDKNKTPEQVSETKQSQPQPQQLPPPLPNPPPAAPPESDTAGSSLGGSDAADDQPVGPWSRLVALVGGLSLAVLIMVMTPIAMIGLWKRRRRRRREHAPDPRRRLMGGWDEVVDLLVDLRAPPAPRKTRLEQADQAGQALGGEAHGMLVLLATASNEAHFAPYEPSEAVAKTYWSSLRQVERTVTAGRSRRQRWRARLSTRSLRRRP